MGASAEIRAGLSNMGQPHGLAAFKILSRTWRRDEWMSLSIVQIVPSPQGIADSFLKLT